MKYKQYKFSVVSRFINDRNLPAPTEIELSEANFQDESSLLRFILDIPKDLSFSIDSYSMNLLIHFIIEQSTQNETILKFTIQNITSSNIFQIDLILLENLFEYLSHYINQIFFIFSLKLIHFKALDNIQYLYLSTFSDQYDEILRFISSSDNSLYIIDTFIALIKNNILDVEFFQNAVLLKKEIFSSIIEYENQYSTYAIANFFTKLLKYYPGYATALPCSDILISNYFNFFNDVNSIINNEDFVYLLKFIVLFYKAVDITSEMALEFIKTLEILRSLSPHYSFTEYVVQGYYCVLPLIPMQISSTDFLNSHEFLINYAIENSNLHKYLKLYSRCFRRFDSDEIFKNVFHILNLVEVTTEYLSENQDLSEKQIFICNDILTRVNLI